MTQHPFGEFLRSRRQYADFTIERLAERSGVSARTISDIERGMSRGPQRRTVIALADALDLADRERADFLSAARPGRRAAAIAPPPVSVRPFRLSDFIGRRAEMDALATVLSAQDGAPTPVVVSGTGGVGKTTVALEALHRATGDDGDILFVNVHSPDTLPLSPLQVLRALLRQAGTADDPETIDDAIAAWRRVSAHRPRAVLLDNVSNEAQVRPALTAAPHTRIVLTSQRTLAGLEGCRRILLGALDRHDSITFLRRMIPAEQRTGELGELAELCADLPLALRIAGNRISSRPAWTVEDFSRRLRGEATRLRHLVAGDLRVESTFTLSYEALPTRTRQIFRSIPLIVGTSFRADTVAALHALDVDATREMLDELTDVALLEPLRGDRYRIHDLLRIFAERRLSAEQTPEEIDTARDRLRRWTLDTAGRMAKITEEDDLAAPPRHPTLAAARDWLTTEANAWLEALKVSAATPADSQVAVFDTARALTRFAERWLSYPHWRTVAEIGVSAAERLGDDRALADQLQVAAALELALMDGNPEVAEQLALRARATAESVGAEESRVWALVTLTWAAVVRGEVASALLFGRRAADEARSHGPADAEVHSRYWVAMALMADDPGAALREVAAMRAVLDEHEDELSLRDGMMARNAMTAAAAKALLRLERYAEAVEIADRMLDDAAFYPHERDYLARAHRHRGLAYVGLGESDRARSDLRRALDLLEEHERPEWWAAEIQSALDALD